MKDVTKYKLLRTEAAGESVLACGETVEKMMAHAAYRSRQDGVPVAKLPPLLAVRLAAADRIEALERELQGLRDRTTQEIMNLKAQLFDATKGASNDA